MWARRPDSSQSQLIKKMKVYLISQGRDPGLAEGYCFALSLAWIDAKFKGREKEFFQRLTKIASWDEKKDASLLFEKFMSHIEWLQRRHKLLHFSQHHIKSITSVITDESGPPLEDEFSLSCMFRIDELETVLGKVIQENKAVRLGSHNHEVAFFYDDGKYEFFNSNNPTGVEIFGSLRDLIEKKYGLIAGYVGENARLSMLSTSDNKVSYVPLTINVLDQVGKPKESYQDPASMIEEVMQERDEKNQLRDVNVQSWGGVTGLWMACRSDDLDSARKLIELGADVNIADDDNFSPLHAAAFGSLSLVHLLVENGAKLNVVYTNKKNGETKLPIDYADSSYDDRVLPYLKLVTVLKMDDVDKFDEYMKANPALLNIKSETGTTWLHMAVKEKAKDILKYLVKTNQIDVNERDKRGKKAGEIAVEMSEHEAKDILDQGKLYQAVCNRKKKRVERLLKKADPKLLANMQILDAAVNHYQSHIFKAVLQAVMADQSTAIDQIKSAIYAAVRQNNLKILKSLIAHAKVVDERFEIDDLTDSSKNTPLLAAIQSGDISLIKFLLSEGASIRKTNIHDQTVLHLAALHGRMDVIELIKGDVEDIKDRQDRYQRTVMHDAAQNGNTHIISVLLDDFHLSMDERDKNDNTPLHEAIDYQNYKAVKFFIEHGANLNAKNYMDETALHLILQKFSGKKAYQLIRLFIENKGDITAVSMGNMTALHHLARFPNAKLMRLFLKMNVIDVNARNTSGETALAEMVKCNYLKGIQLLIKCHADVQVKNKNGEGLLHLAAELRKNDTVSFLLKYGLDVNEKNINGDTPLHFVMYSDRNYTEIMGILLSNGADIFIKNTSGETPLDMATSEEQKKYLLFESAVYAIAHGDAVRLAQLMKAGFDINSYDKEGNTALHLAILNGDQACIHLLMDAGKEEQINRPNFHNETPLMLACRAEREDVVNELLKRKANVHNRADYGVTAMHIAAHSGNMTIVETLLKAGADIDTAQVDGTTPLHLAVMQDHAKVVNFLIKKGANKYAFNKRGQDALMLAGQSDIAGIIKKDGINLVVRQNDKTAGKLLRVLAKYDDDKQVKKLIQKIKKVTKNQDRQHFEMAVVHVLEQAKQVDSHPRIVEPGRHSSMPFFGRKQLDMNGLIEKCIKQMTGTADVDQQFKHKVTGRM